jgi:uncharacterized damage-inducible protein DinB
MSELALPADDLLTWVDKTAQNWKKLIVEHPESLRIACDIAGVKSAAELLQHIVAVELRYAERLAGVDETPYEKIAFDSAEKIYLTHNRAMGMFRELLADGSYDWSQELEFNTRSLGRLKAPRSGILFHTLLHSVRHYAQLATLVRQNGIKPDWPMDYLFMAARRVEG